MNDVKNRVKSGVPSIRVDHEVVYPGQSMRVRLENGMDILMSLARDRSMLVVCEPEGGFLPDERMGVASRIAQVERDSGGFVIKVDGLVRVAVAKRTMRETRRRVGVEYVSGEIVPSRALDAGTAETMELVAEERNSALQLAKAMLAVGLTGLLSRPATVELSESFSLSAAKIAAFAERADHGSAAHLADVMMGVLPVGVEGSATVQQKVQALYETDSVRRVSLVCAVSRDVSAKWQMLAESRSSALADPEKQNRAVDLLAQLARVESQLGELGGTGGITAEDSAIRKLVETAFLQGQAPSTSRAVVIVPPGGLVGGGAGNATKIGGRAPGDAPGRFALPSNAPSDDDDSETSSLEKALAQKKFTAEAEAVVKKEYARLKATQPQSAEHGVIRNYLETLVSLPWLDATDVPEDPKFAKHAQQKLDDDHYGMEQVKKRLVEWLTVLRLSQEMGQHQKDANPNQKQIEPPKDAQRKPRAPSSSQVPSSPKAPILLLCGPPGVGKTSIARSLADAMGRKFERISLGGVRDEAEIRGHRRTYVGAMPGMIINAVKRAGVNNPVILLDEIDKLGLNNQHGDPAAALLEVLDPEQNATFTDHYVGIPFDLSSVVFITTANTLDTLSEPLYDRMEAIELSGYVYNEKLEIAKKYLIPKQVARNALRPYLIDIPDETLMHVIMLYTRESGVRSLERCIGALCRAKAVQYTNARGDATGFVSLDKLQGYTPLIDKEAAEQILGNKTFLPEQIEDLDHGIAAGLAYQGSGNGGLLFIESTRMPGNGQLKLTGRLGDVISESAQLAMAWVRSHAFELGIAPYRDADIFKDVNIHIHLPSGSIKKDGPSAGVALVVSLVSLMRRVPVRPALAMTGEITLRGRVTPVGGIREKVLAAHRAGIRALILPERNAKDVISDIPAEVQRDIHIDYVSSLWDALRAAFGADFALGTGELYPPHL